MLDYIFLISLFIIITEIFFYLFYKENKSYNWFEVKTYSLFTSAILCSFLYIFLAIEFEGEFGQLQFGQLQYIRLLGLSMAVIFFGLNRLFAYFIDKKRDKD